MLRHDDLDGHKTSEFGAYDVFTHLADEQGVADHTGAAQLVVALLKLPLANQSRLVAERLRLFLGVFLLLREFGDLRLFPSELGFHFLDLGGSGGFRDGITADLAELLLKRKPVLLDAKLVDLAAHHHNIILRGVPHPVLHPLE